MTNNEIVAPFNTQFSILAQLARLTNIRSMDITIHFILNKSSLMQAYYSGISIEEMQDFLQTYSKTSLPQTMVYLLQELGEKEGEVELLPTSGYLRIRDHYLLEEVKVHIRPFILESFGSDRIILRPGLNLYQIEKQLKQKGYFLKSKMEPENSDVLPSSQLSELLDSIEPPTIDPDELDFDYLYCMYIFG